MGIDKTNGSLRNNLYIGGSFTVVNGVTVNRIARWDGTTWFALGSPTIGLNSGNCNGVTIDSNSNVYVTGTFTLAGGVANTIRVAKWDGSVWNPLTTGLGTGAGNTITVDSTNNVYVGGAFLLAGGVTVNLIAKWNPLTSVWSALSNGLGITSSCLNIRCKSEYVYAGGNFAGNVSTADTSTPGSIAVYDTINNCWTPVGGSFQINRTGISILTLPPQPYFKSIRPFFVPQTTVGLMQMSCIIGFSGVQAAQYLLTVQASTDFAFTNPITLVTDVITNSAGTPFQFIPLNVIFYNQNNLLANQAYYLRVLGQASANVSPGVNIEDVRNFSLAWANT